MKIVKQCIAATFIILAASLLVVALPQSPVLAKSPVAELNLSSAGLALRGYDPVAYFKSGKPKIGKKAITAIHGGGTYRFSSEANREAFLAEPAKYLPQYGGFCAYGTAANYKVDGDPNVWKIVDNKLYLNINKSVGRSWESRQDHYIRKADKVWPKIRSK